MIFSTVKKTASKLIILVLISVTFSTFAQSKDGYYIILDGKEVFFENTVITNKTIAAPDENIQNSNKSIAIHVVKRGENLYSISRLYGITVDELARLNNFSTSLRLTVGDRLKISSFSKAVAVDNNASFHTVVKGNTLYSLSKKYGISVDKLTRLNNIKNNIILIGQRLKLN